MNNNSSDEVGIMGYLEAFQKQMNHRDFTKFMQLWEEYCTSDNIDTEEFKQLLEMIKKDEMSKQFGKYIETALPLWETVKDPHENYEVLRLLIDLQTTNSPLLADKSTEALKNKYEKDPNFNERLRIVGLRNRTNFPGAISNYDLLVHMKLGNFVFHTGGWGTGEVMDISPLREEVTIEFENISGRKIFSFSNAFKTLIPLQKDNFLVRRFAFADDLEREARENPTAVIRLLLKDLGPKTAAEIKDALCELVIPEPDWVKWWQNARAKLKKDTLIDAPDGVRVPFKLRKSELTHEERLKSALQGKTDINEIIQTTYNFARDFPNTLKNQDTQASQKDKLLGLLKLPEITHVQELQIAFFLENYLNTEIPGKSVKEIIAQITDFEEVINSIEILAFKKRVLTAIHDFRTDWQDIFLELLFSLQQGGLRDYILKELMQSKSNKALVEKLRALMHQPGENPEFVVWYFQKITDSEEAIPFSDKEGQGQFFEAFLVLIHYIESKAQYKDLLKKMHNMISSNRFALVRTMIEGKSMPFIKEFLLLVSKCHSFNDHDLKILRSLAEVVQPTLSKKSAESKSNPNVIWTTEEGLLKTQQRVKTIGTTEIVDNAKEIEAARALGDLRENSEYKFALERRSRLQAEMKVLSDQLNRARIITKDDIPVSEVGVGVVVSLKDSQGKVSKYTILGPWDADPEKNILSFQTKLVQSMVGLKEGEHFNFRDEEFTIVGISSYLT